jgi:predicted transcriptional regulator
MISPLDRKLALAPIDDEPLTPDEVAAIEAGRASLAEGRGVPMEDVLADFGLTMDDFRKMAETPLSEDPAQ